MNFETWIKKQKHRDDPIGDLAKDFIRGQKIKKFKTILESMNYFGACDDAVKSLRKAKRQYLDEMERINHAAT